MPCCGVFREATLISSSLSFPRLLVLLSLLPYLRFSPSTSPFLPLLFPLCLLRGGDDSGHHEVFRMCYLALALPCFLPLLPCTSLSVLCFPFNHPLFFFFPPAAPTFLPLHPPSFLVFPSHFLCFPPSLRPIALPFLLSPFFLINVSVVSCHLSLSKLMCLCCC